MSTENDSKYVTGPDAHPSRPAPSSEGSRQRSAGSESNTNSTELKGADVKQRATATSDPESLSERTSSSGVKQNEPQAEKLVRRPQSPQRTASSQESVSQQQSAVAGLPTAVAPQGSTVVGMVGKTPIVRLPENTSQVVRKKRGRFTLLEDATPSQATTVSAADSGDPSDSKGGTSLPAPNRERANSATSNTSTLNNSHSASNNANVSAPQTFEGTGAPVIKKKGRFFVTNLKDPGVISANFNPQKDNTVPMKPDVGQPRPGGVSLVQSSIPNQVVVVPQIATGSGQSKSSDKTTEDSNAMPPPKSVQEQNSHSTGIPSITKSTDDNSSTGEPTTRKAPGRPSSPSRSRTPSRNVGRTGGVSAQTGLGKVFYFLDQMRLEVTDADKTIKTLHADMKFLKEKNKELETKVRETERKLADEKALREASEGKLKMLRKRLRALKGLNENGDPEQVKGETEETLSRKNSEDVLDTMNGSSDMGLLSNGTTRVASPTMGTKTLAAVQADCDRRISETTGVQLSPLHEKGDGNKEVVNGSMLPPTPPLTKRKQSTKPVMNGYVAGRSVSSASEIHVPKPLVQSMVRNASTGISAQAHVRAMSVDASSLSKGGPRPNQSFDPHAPANGMQTSDTESLNSTPTPMYNMNHSNLSGNSFDVTTDTRRHVVASSLQVKNHDVNAQHLLHGSAYPQDIQQPVLLVQPQARMMATDAATRNGHIPQLKNEQIYGGHQGQWNAAHQQQQHMNGNNGVASIPPHHVAGQHALQTMGQSQSNGLIQMQTQLQQHGQQHSQQQMHQSQNGQTFSNASTQNGQSFQNSGTQNVQSFQNTGMHQRNVSTSSTASPPVNGGNQQMHPTDIFKPQIDQQHANGSSAASMPNGLQHQQPQQQAQVSTNDQLAQEPDPFDEILNRRPQNAQQQHTM